MREYHSRPRPLHHVLYLLPHIRLVAMDLAEGTELFIDLERTLFEAEEGVFRERPTLLAQLLPFRPVLTVAILFDHHGDELFFLLPRFEFFGRFLRFCSLHDLPLLRRFVRVCELMGEKLGTQWRTYGLNKNSPFKFPIANQYIV